MSLASLDLGKPSYTGLARVLWAPGTEAVPIGEGQAARQGPANHKRSPLYSLSTPPFFLPFSLGFLQGPWDQLLCSLKITQAALGVKEPLLLAGSQRPSSWQLVSTAPQA